MLRRSYSKQMACALAALALTVQSAAATPPVTKKVSPTAPRWGEPVKRKSIRFLACAGKDSAGLDKPKQWVTLAPLPKSAMLSGYEPPAALFSEIKAMSDFDRKNYFARFTGRQQAEVWALHFENFASTRTLSAAQSAVISELISVVRGADFDALDQIALNARMVALRLKTIDIFGQEGSDLLLRQLGNVTYAARVAPAARPRKGETAFLPTCDCSTAIFCIQTYAICDCFGNCKTTNYGCGWFWLDACFGCCVDQWNCEPWCPYPV